MTSWSLTILFAHLWISAFISLYFYSINEKSCLASLFSQLFGPFSCSSSNRQHNQQSKKSKITKHQKKNNCFNGTNKIRNLFVKKSNISTNIITTFTSCPENNNTNIQRLKLSVSNLNETTTPNCGTKHVTTTDTEINFLTGNSNDQQEHPIIIQAANNTYCEIPIHHLCHIPSSIVISNADAWKLWIHTHVPSFVLILIKTDWLLFNLLAVSALIVTCMYFTYSYLVDLQAEPTWIHELGNVHRHGINSIVALIDVVMLGYPIRVFHFVYVIIYGWVYAFVTLVYWLQNPKDHVIYDQINYRQPFKMILGYVLLTMVVFFMQVAHFFVYRLKVYIRERYCKNACKTCFITQQDNHENRENISSLTPPISDDDITNNNDADDTDTDNNTTVHIVATGSGNLNYLNFFIRFISIYCAGTLICQTQFSVKN